MDSSALDSSAMDSSAILYTTSQMLIVYCYDSYKQNPNKCILHVDVAVHVGKCIQGPCSALPDIQSIREYGNIPNS